ncbi:MAG TPA: patatin-like phospholipase family protein [Nitrososphaeraceae archaeon]|jgi:NTE family protein
MRENNQNLLLRDSKTVLVLQGGGSLGAYECGVYKSLSKNGIDFDILAGASIGALNASIIVSAQNAGGGDPSSILEEFWLSLSENNGLPNTFLRSTFPFISSDKMMAIWSSIISLSYGNPNVFIPRWFIPSSKDYFVPYRWTYLFDLAPLKKTLKDYLDADKLKKINHNSNRNDNEHNTKNDDRKNTRLIISCTDIQKGESVIFDNAYIDIDIEKIVACAGYPFYGLKWTEEDGKYLWDGSLLSNTPMLEVARRSPQIYKKFYIVDVFPRQQKELPTNMTEVWHRARDIIFMDKTDKSIETLKEMDRYLFLIRHIYEVLHSNKARIDEVTREKLKEMELEYHSLNQKHGASLTDVVRIGRREESLHYLLEDTDFSTYRIKKLIAEGENDADHILAKIKR